MDPALSEIDQIISDMTSEKVGSNSNAVSHGVDEQTNHDTADDDFLESILNEMTRGNVSNLDTIDDGTIAAIFPPPPVALPTQDPYGNTTAISQPFSATINQPVSDDGINIVNHQLNNGTSTPASDVAITYQLAGQTYQLSEQVFMLFNPMSSSQNSVVPVVATTLPTQLVDMAPPSVANSDNSDVQEIEMVASPGSSGSRKRKLYEVEEEFSDPELEKKRHNAINAKKHREMKKQTIQNLQDELKIVKQERDVLKKVNERQTLQSQQDHESLVKEVEDLKKEKEDMRKQLQALQQQYEDSLQQEKIGFPDMHFSFDF